MIAGHDLLLSHSNEGETYRDERYHIETTLVARPVVYALDENRIILDKDLRGATLDEAVEKLLLKAPERQK